MQKNKKDYLLNVLRVVSEQTLIPEIEIVSAKRNRPISDARKIFCHAVYKNRNSLLLSLEEIGSFLNRDHSTVITNKNQADNVKMTDHRFRSMLSEVHSRLNDKEVNVEQYNNIPQL
jgi:chromosomal replication initiation ATPase DnaA